MPRVLSRSRRTLVIRTTLQRLGSLLLDRITFQVLHSNTKSRRVSRSCPSSCCEFSSSTSLTLSFSFKASARYQNPYLPPIQSTNMEIDPYHSRSAGVLQSTTDPREVRSPREARQQGPGLGPVPRFQKVQSAQELQPRINVQPPFRRANPEGGFISVSPTFLRLSSFTD